MEASFCYQKGKLEKALDYLDHGSDCECEDDCFRKESVDPGVKFSFLKIKVGDITHEYKDVKLFKYQHSQGSEDLFSIDEWRNMKS